MANLDRQRLLRLLPYLGRDRRRLLLTLVLLIPVAGAAAVQPLLVGQAISALRQEPVLAWLVKAHQRQGLSLAALQQRFRLPPHRPLPAQRIPQHNLQSYDDLHVFRAQAPSSGSRSANPDAAAAAGMDPLPLAEPRRAG